jgi:hypothetical protein
VGKIASSLAAAGPLVEIDFEVLGNRLQLIG